MMSAPATPRLLPPARALSGWRLEGVRLLLALFGLYAALSSLAGLGFRVQDLSQGEAAQFFGNGLNLTVRVGSSALTALVYCTFAAALAWYKAALPLAALTALALFSASVTVVDLSPALALPWVRQVTPFLSALSPALLMLLLLLFPTGRFASKPERALGYGWAALCTAWWLFPAMPYNIVYFETFVRTPLASVAATFGPFVLAFGLAFWHRGRMRDPLERARLGWFLAGGLAFFVGVLFNSLLRAFPAPVEAGGQFFYVVRPALVNLALLMLPACLTVAHFHYGLFGPEIVAEKSLTYLLLSGALVALYATLVYISGALGLGFGSSLVLVVVTAMTAVLLQPARVFLERRVRRLLYGERDDPLRVLSRLSRTLELSGDPLAALRAIGRTLEHSLKLEAGALTVRPGADALTARPGADALTVRSEGESEEVYAWGRAEGGERLEFPLVSQGEVHGFLWVRGRALSSAQHSLLEEVARHAGRAAFTVRLWRDLLRSRETLILAREEERKRLRRDLHDGLGPLLSSLAVRLESACEDSPDPTVRAQLEGVQGGLREAVRDLRRLVQGLRPPALDDLGLVGALREFLRGFPLPVSLEQGALPPLSAALEVALYRIALEALHNVHKHAGASRVRLSLGLREGALELCVADDGRGLPRERERGVGLRSMRERAEELGGSLALETGLEQRGLKVCARFPLPTGDA